jgi:drug/metabolite transporter (DMT)-like permease
MAIFTRAMKRPLSVLFLGVLSASFAAVFIRLADAPPLVIAAFRLALASLILFPITCRRVLPEIKSLRRGEILLAILAGAFLALHFGLWITSLRYTSVATSVVLVTADPIFVAFASYLLFGEKISRRTVLGLAIGIAGVLLIGYANWKSGPVSLLGAVLALAAALAVAGYVLTGRKIRKRVGLLAYISIVYTASAVFLLTAALGAGYSFFGYSCWTYLMMVLLALIPQLLGHTSLNWALRYIPATLAAIAFLGEPVAASIWALIILGEKPAALEIVGGIIVIGGIIAALYRAPSSELS